MRNPKWHRDEIILALDLYFSANRGSIDKNNPRVVELSKTLNTLPLFPDRPDAEKFRNVNGVVYKLSNFLPFDKGYKGKGMTHGSRLDEQLFEEFANQKTKLHSIANEIRKAISDEQLRKEMQNIEEDEQTQEDSVVEGQVLYRLHKVRERDKEIVRRKKEQVMARNGILACEACVFSFEEYYGEMGAGFIECHHRVPLSQFKVEKRTSLEDLALVCSNCHRMLHKRIDTLSVDDLRLLLKYPRSGQMK